MNKPPDLFPPEPPALPVGIEWEYHTLRAEIVSRIQARHQILSITLTIAGVFLGVGLNTPGIVLAYPPLAMFLTYAWAQNDLRVRNIAMYIREHIETKRKQLGLHWELSVQQSRITNNDSLWHKILDTFADGGVFLWTESMALFIGSAQIADAYKDDSLSDLMAIVDVTLFLLAIMSLILTWQLIHIIGNGKETQPGESEQS